MARLDGAKRPGVGILVPAALVAMLCFAGAGTWMLLGPSGQLHSQRALRLTPDNAVEAVGNEREAQGAESVRRQLEAALARADAAEHALKQHEQQQQEQQQQPAEQQQGGTALQDERVRELEQAVAAAEERATGAEAALKAALVQQQQQQQQQEQQPQQPTDTQGGGNASTLAAGLRDWGYQPSVPDDVLDKGIVSYGSMARARRVVHKMLQGDKVHVAVLGGSITWGQGASQQGETDWGSFFSSWAHNASLGAVEYTNRAIPATPSSYMSLCVNFHAPEDIDLVIVEYNINDGGSKGDTPIRRSHERLLRKLLAFPNRPAVMELVFYRWPAPEQFVNEELVFSYGGDNELGLLAQYYHLPWFSTRSLMWDKWAAKGAKEHPDFMNGPDHPNDLGHRYMADMVIAYLRHIVEDLGLRPYGQADKAVVDAPLPPPMFKDNEPVGRSTCLMGPEFKPLMVEANGFEWVNDSGDERKPKFGWAGNTTGATLVWEFNSITAAEGQQLQQDVLTPVVIVYLMSYEHMGNGEVTCVSGCECKPMRLEGHQKVYQWSQNALASVDVSPAEHCRMQVTILDETESGERRVKINGLIMSDAQGQETGFELQVDHELHAEFGQEGGFHF